MNASLFRATDEKKLPPRYIGRMRPVTWTAGYSHIVVRQQTPKVMNGCPPVFHGDISDCDEFCSEVKTKLKLVPVGSFRLVEPAQTKAQLQTETSDGG